MIKVRLKNRPREVVEIHEHQILDLQRWDMILEYVQEEEHFDDEQHDEGGTLAPGATEAVNDSGEDKPVVTYMKRHTRRKRKASPDSDDDQGSVGE